MPLADGARVGPFEVEAPLGSGGMGEVYRARDPRLGRLVALKVVRGDVAGPDAARALLAEARAAASLNHPGIATVYEVGELGEGGAGAGYVAMELVDGETLDLHARSGVPLCGLVDVAVQVAEALAVAHARGVVHRDVKPRNVVVTPGGRAKVLDFGLAVRRCAADADAATLDLPADSGARDEAFVGTLAYVAPEQALGHAVDGRADVFSLGAVLYELLTSRRAFEGETVGAVLEAVLHVEPPPPSRLNAEVTPELTRIVRKMLEKEPERRYQTMRDVALDLAAARDELVGAREAGTGAQGREAAVAVTAFANITARAEDGWLATGLAETVAADLKRIPGLGVVASERVDEASRRLRAERGSLPDETLAVEAGRRLGARWVVAGGFQRVGDRLRITARVVETASGQLLRAVKVDGAVDGVFALQDRVVAELAEGLAAALGAPVPSDAIVEETKVVAAWEAYSKALLNLRTASLDGVDRAIVLLEKAVALDPRYAAAHVSLGWALQDKSEYVGLAELSERALEIFRRALSLDPASVEAMRGTAYALLHLRRDDEALSAARRAVATAPSDPASRTALGRVLFAGLALFAEAATEFEAALALNPQAGWVALQLAHCRTLTGELDRAETAAVRAIELQRRVLSGKEGLRIVGAHLRLAHVRSRQGRHAEALAEVEKERQHLASADHALGARAGVEVLVRRGSALVKLGREAEGRESLTRSVEAFEARAAAGADDPFTRYYAAQALSLLGEHERALDVLSEAARMRPAFTLRRALVEPDLAPLAGTPRFAALLAGAGLAASSSPGP